MSSQAAGKASAVAELARRALTDGGKQPAIVHLIINDLLEHNQAYRARLCPDEVGIHPSNRDGGGVEESHVHDIGRKIVRMGFLAPKCAGAVCVEEDAQGTIGEFTVNCLAAAPRLAPTQNIK